MDIAMATGTFRLKGRQLYAKGYADRRVKNIQEVATKSGMTYPTAFRWIDRPEEITGINLENLAGFLIDGLGLTPEEVINLRLGDVFDFVPHGIREATE